MLAGGLFLTARTSLQGELSVPMTWHLASLTTRGPQESKAEATVSFVIKPQKSHTITTVTADNPSVWKDQHRGRNSNRQGALGATREAGYHGESDNDGNDYHLDERERIVKYPCLRATVQILMKKPNGVSSQ